jgi:hypothetical protein
MMLRCDELTADGTLSARIDSCQDDGRQQGVSMERQLTGVADVVVHFVVRDLATCLVRG